MTNFLSIVMVIVMLFSGLSSVTANLPQPMVYEQTSSVDAEGLLDLVETYSGSVPQAAGANLEQAKQVIPLLAEIINKVTVRIALDKGYVEYSIDTPSGVLLNLGGGMDDSRLAVATSMVPDTLLTMDKEMVNALTTQLMTSLSQLFTSGDGATGLANVDMQALSTVVTAELTTALVALQAKFTETETGTFEVDGSTFQQKVSGALTAKEAKVIGLTALKHILENENVQPLLSMAASANVDAEQLKKQVSDALEAAQAGEDGQTAYISMYNAADGSGQYITVSEAEDGKTGRYVGMGMANGTAVVHAGDNQNTTLDADIGAAGMNAVLKTQSADGRALEAKIDVTIEGGTNIQEKASLIWNGKEVLAQNVTFGPQEKIERLTDGTFTDEIKLETLLTDTDGTAAQPLMMKLLTGVMTLPATLNGLVESPENKELLNQLMNPGATTVVTE